MRYFKTSNLNKIVFFLAVLFLVSIKTVFDSFAMGASISFSDVNAELGDEVNLIMTLSSTGGDIDSANIMLSYDDAILEFVNGTNAQGGAGSIRITTNTGSSSNSQTFSLKFKAKSVGEAAVVVSTWEIYDKASKMAIMESQGSGKIRISDKEDTSGETLSAETTSSEDKKDALLLALQVSPGKLSPEFNTEIKNYDMNVGGNISNISVNAKARQDGARVIITGNDNLLVGVNAITVKVTAPDGITVQNYIINVNKAEAVSIAEESSSSELDNSETSVLEIISTNDGLTFGGIDYKVSDSFDRNLMPEGFEEAVFDYKGREVKAGKMKDRDIYILYLVGNDGSGDFYIYDKDADSWSLYAQISTGSKSITVLPLDEGVEVPKGFKKSTINLNGKKISGWIWSSDNEKRYCIVYAMNSEGRKDFYRYDVEEKTIQRYFTDPNVDTGVSTEKYNALKNRTYALAAILIVSLIGIIAMSISNNNKVKRERLKAQENNNVKGITPRVDLISEEDMNDESALEYMVIANKKGDNKAQDNNGNDFDEVNLDSDGGFEAVNLENDKLPDDEGDFEDIDI